MNSSSSILIVPMDFSHIQTIQYLEKEQNISILSESSIRSDLENPNYHYFIAKSKNEIVGYIAISMIIDHIDILSIVVKKEYQRQGIAKNLLSFIMEFGKENHIEQCFLEVRESNLKAQMLYQTSGFSLISTRKGYYSDTHENALIYQKNLLES